jgi:hypothetical protein
LGVAEADEDTIRGIDPLFPAPRGGLAPEDLLAYYDPPAIPLLDKPPPTITLDLLRQCLDAAPPLSTPHNDGWRNEHFIELMKDPACGMALADFLIVVHIGDVPSKMADILSPTTLVVLFNKDEATMEEMKRRLGPTYVHLQGPVDMGMALVKVACNCALLLVKESMGATVGPT